MVFIQIDGNQDLALCATIVRAFSNFPITWLDGTIPEGVTKSNEELAPRRHGRVPNEGLAGVENIMRCPAHAHGPRRMAARRFIGLHADLMEVEPQIPGMIYICRWEKEINYFTFGELGDIVRIMPLAGSISYVPTPRNHRVQWLTSLGARAAAPRPVHAVVPIWFADSYQWDRSCTPGEIWAMIYLPLSRGAKGLCYGKRPPAATNRPPTDTRGSRERQGWLTPDSTKALEQVTRELDMLRKYLRFADYIPTGRTNNPHVEAATLWAGDRAVVVLAINHECTDFGDEHRKCAQQRNIETTVSLAPGLRAVSILDVRSGRQLNDWRQDDVAVVMQIDELDVARPYLIRLAPCEGRR
jgi:hypothetical protein